MGKYMMWANYDKVMTNSTVLLFLIRSKKNKL